MRGFTQPLAVVVGLLVCVVIGYALANGFSHARDANAHMPRAAIGVGRSLDEPLPGETRADATIRSEEPPGQEALLAAEPELGKPQLPEPGTTTYEGYVDVSFARLSNYEYRYPEVGEPDPPDQIPAEIRALNGKKVAIRGFMNPIEMKDGRVVEFLLMKSQSLCCFGIWPQMNEWIHVKMKPGQSAPFLQDIPITVLGTLEVGEVYHKKLLESIYRMQFDRLIEPVR